MCRRSFTCLFLFLFLILFSYVKQHRKLSDSCFCLLLHWYIFNYADLLDTACDDITIYVGHLSMYGHSTSVINIAVSYNIYILSTVLSVLICAAYMDLLSFLTVILFFLFNRL